MVSKLYPANEYYSKQKKGEVGKNHTYIQKLHKSSKGYYIYNKPARGKSYSKVYADSSDKVYSRSEGATIYSKELDRKRDNTKRKESVKYHNTHKHFSDRKATTGKTYNV